MRPELSCAAGFERIAEPLSPLQSPLQPPLGTPPRGGARPTARELLDQICEGDPLRLAAAALGRIRVRAVLVEPAHISSKAAARAAFELARDGRLDSAPARVAEWIDRAIDDELEDQRDTRSDGIPSLPGEFLRSLAARLGMEPGLLPAACIVFNALPTRVRRVFFGAIVQGQSLAELEAAGLGDRATLERRLRAALGSISLLRASQPHPDDGSADDE